MSPEGAIRVEHVWKRFRTTRRGRVAKEHLRRIALRASGRAKANPWRWVLRDIRFDIEPGESVGLVGVNGSGKSTLLKIISGVMFPHSGRVETQGRIGALIEVTSGIHPELTGRENVMVYGSLLGLGRREVARRFDEIVAFAEIETAVDRQVKYYSSGMKMRVGFAIAAFLEPSILVVDEVLAVGDSSFQQKCLDRMREVLQQGTTLLLVSHDLAAVGAIAHRGLWLHDGRICADGSIDDVLGAYRHEIESLVESRSRSLGKVRVSEVRTFGPEGKLAVTNEPLRVECKVETDDPRPAVLYLGVSEGAPTPVFVVRHEFDLPAGRTPVTVDFPRLPLPAGEYFLWFAAYGPGLKEYGQREELSPWHPIGPLDVYGERMDPVPPAIVRLAPVFVEAGWSAGTRDRGDETRSTGAPDRPM